MVLSLLNLRVIPKCAHHWARGKTVVQNLNRWNWELTNLFDHTPPPKKMPFVIWTLKDGYDHSAGNTCMGKQSIADVDTYMRWQVPLEGKEEEISKLYIFTLNRNTKIELFLTRVWQAHIKCRSKYFGCEPRTIDSIGINPAKTVRSPHQLKND